MYTVSNFTRSARSTIRHTTVDQPNVISVESDQISRSARHDYSLTFRRSD